MNPKSFKTLPFHSPILSAAECSAAVEAILSHGLSYYRGEDKAGKSVKKGKIGPNVFRYRSDIDTYLNLAHEANNFIEAELFNGASIMPQVMEVVGSHFKMNCRFGHLHNRPACHCIIRELSSAPLHTDFVVNEAPEIARELGVISQYAWNIYLTAPKVGGETVCSDGDQKLVFPPELGRMLVFDSTKPHEVLKTKETRLTLSGFFGETTHNDIVFWV